MTTYYLDSSALIKRYVTDEQGSAWFDLVLARSNTVILTSRVSIVEVRSAFARKFREASILPQQLEGMISAFREDCLLRYRFVEVESHVIDLATHVLDQHILRAYDAIQLASALRANELLTLANLTPLIFVCADVRLLSAAQNASLLAENPNDH